jgi:DNA replication protein DnaC
MHPLPTCASGMTRVSKELFPDKVVIICPEPQSTDPTCPICGGARYTRHDVPFGHPAFGKAIPCQCQRNEQQKRAGQGTYTWLGASEDEAQTLASMTFETFHSAYQPEAYREACEFARQTSVNLAEQPNILMVGSNGTGKTHLVAAILNELRFSYCTCLFTTVPHLFSVLYSASFERKTQILAQAAQASLLCLDDLDKLHVREDGGTYQKQTLFELVNQRYLAHKPTLITTNAQDGLHPWLDKATLSRLFSNIRGIKMDGQDYRQIKRKREVGQRSV